MADIRLSKHWDREVENGFPDSRLRHGARENKQVSRFGMTFDVMFCANCGRSGGLAVPMSPHMYYLCDPCAEKLGKN